MTPKEIAAHLMTANVLDKETMAPFHDFHEAKRATGAPTELEYAVFFAAEELQRATDNLRDHCLAMQRAHADMLSGFEMYGVRMGRGSPSFPRDTTEMLHLLLRQASEKFRDAVRNWAALTDRIVATDEDRAEALKQKHERRAAALSRMSARELRALARESGLKVGTEKAEIVAAILTAEGA